jgi:hypothetical protein
MGRDVPGVLLLPTLLGLHKGALYYERTETAWAGGRHPCHWTSSISDRIPQLYALDRTDT